MPFSFGAPAPAPPAGVFGGAPAPAFGSSAPVAAPASKSGFAASPAPTQFTFGTGVAAPASSISSLSGNKFSAMSASVGVVDIAEFLIREEAEKERESIRKGSLANLKALGVPNHHSFARWEVLQEDPEQKGLNASIFHQRVRSGQQAMFLKEAEGIWRFYPPNCACNFECKEILSLSGFSRQFEASGCIIERETIKDRGGYTTEDFYRLFTTKAAYYQSRLTKTAKAYDEEMLKFTSAIKKVNEWENDMLLGNNIKSKTSSFQSQDMCGKILKAWEDKIRPVKPATSQQGLPFASGQQTPQPTFANLPDSTSNKPITPKGFGFNTTTQPSTFGQAPQPTFANLPGTSKKAPTTPAFGTTIEPVTSTEKHPPQHPALSEKKPVSPVGLKENTDTISSSEKVDISSKETQTHTTLEKEEETERLEHNAEEIADFLRLWDKYNHRLEEILVQRHLKRSPLIQEPVQSSGSIEKPSASETQIQKNVEKPVQQSSGNTEQPSSSETGSEFFIPDEEDYLGDY